MKEQDEITRIRTKIRIKDQERRTRQNEGRKNRRKEHAGQKSIIKKEKNERTRTKEWGEEQDERT